MGNLVFQHIFEYEPKGDRKKVRHHNQGINRGIHKGFGIHNKLINLKICKALYQALQHEEKQFPRGIASLQSNG
jgi:hypothetical protein